MQPFGSYARIYISANYICLYRFLFDAKRFTLNNIRKSKILASKKYKAFITLCTVIYSGLSMTQS